MESLVYLVFTPLSLALLGAVSVAAWRRREVPGGRALCAFTAMSVWWLSLDALALTASDPSTSVALAQATMFPAALMCVSWLTFVLSYTERLTRVARRAVVALTAWSVGYGVLGVTNRAHGLVWSSWDVVPDGMFSFVTYVLGPVGWAQTAFAWASIALSLVVILRVYAGERVRARHLSWWIVVGAFLPMVLSVAFQFGLGPLGKDFTPISMAFSAGAFALGLARYQFLDLRPLARAALVDDLREGMLVLDADGRVADANPALLTTFGADAVSPGSVLRDTAPALARAIEYAPGDTFRHVGGDRARYYDLRVSPLTGRSGEASGLLVLLHDVTRRRGERAELHRVNTELYDRNAELQARNDELDAFAHTVAHDLKNSVHGIIGWAEVLRDDGSTMAPHEYREAAEGVVRTGRKMGTVVHELLLLAGVRKAVVAPRPVAMAQVVAEAAERVRRSGVPPASVVPSAWPVAMGHAPWIEEIWVNYLTNATKYGGSRVTLGTDTTASHARFWVHDDGPGLSLEEQRQLFVPFARVGSQSAEGHGLGLSIVRRIAERLGGMCGVESAPGVGTRFWFALPLAETAATSARPDVLAEAVEVR